MAIGIINEMPSLPVYIPKGYWQVFQVPILRKEEVERVICLIFNESMNYLFSPRLPKNIQAKFFWIFHHFEKA